MVDQETTTTTKNKKNSKKQKTAKIRKVLSHGASPSPASTRAFGFAFASIFRATEHVPQPIFFFWYSPSAKGN